MYALGVPASPAYKHYPHLASTTKWAGIPLMAISLIGASFASSVKTLIVTQGVLYAVGGSMVYYPTLIFLDEWFVRRKGMAYGVMWVCYPSSFSVSVIFGLFRGGPLLMR